MLGLIKNKQFTALSALVSQKAGAGLSGMRLLDRGHAATLYLADMEDGQRLVVKCATVPSAQMDIEGWMLSYLANHSDLPVPPVIWADKMTLIMSYLPDCGHITRAAQADAAAYLARLHCITAPCYGLERDTMIGPFPQPNAQAKSWVDFFRERRLLYMARMAFKEGCIDNTLMAGLEKLGARLDDLIGDAAAPGLIHGDMWGGNILSRDDKVIGFIDPAIYFADPEIELAFSTMFKTFGEPFFKRYDELNPIRPGFFEVRCDLYNLYPLLVHARLYGGPYVDNIRAIVTRFVG